MQVFQEWYRRYFTDPQIIIMVVLLIFAVLAIWTLGGLLTPVFASLVIAYLLDGPVATLERLRMPRIIAVLLIFLLFMTFMFFLIFGLLPIISIQVGQFVRDLPSMFSRGKALVMHLPQRYPDLISQNQVSALMDIMQNEIGMMSKTALSFSLASVRGLLTFVVYMILMPLMVFFFLKDKFKILTWIKGLLPEGHTLTGQVWREVNRQIGNYTRGKFWEIVIVWTVSYLTFSILGLEVAMLVALAVGLSVLVPFIGVTVVAFPVALTGYFQWGVHAEFVYLLISYAVIQLLDGNLLAPLLLSEVVDLHPVAIITAVLLFGGLWGVWGVFFAIPLATLVQAVVRAWYQQAQGERPDDSGL
jgi:putative permease